MYVQFGCGLCAPAGWVNFDASPTLRLQRVPVVGRVVPVAPRFPQNVRYGDVVKGLPVEPGSCRAVYSSHVLEHLALEDMRQALRNVHGHLKPGGVFRFVVPDLEKMARQYVASQSPEAAVAFIEATRMGLEQRPRGVRGLLRTVWGNSGHRWMWDYKGLAHELEAAGFIEIRRAEYGDSEDPRFTDVESETRWRGSVGVECRRPG